MKKLRLDLDNLLVDSFGTGAGVGSGTVNGHNADMAAAVNPTIIATDPDTDPSRVNSCYFNTCYAGCDWTQ